MKLGKRGKIKSTGKDEDELEEELINDEKEKNLHKNNSDKTIILKNLNINTTEEDISSLIKAQDEDIDIQDVRVIKDKKGVSRGYAFIDLSSHKNALACVDILNNVVLDDSLVTCAISKPPSSG